MKRQSFFKIAHTVPISTTDDELYTILANIAHDNIFSYIVYLINNNWRIEYTLHENIKYNTLDSIISAIEIHNICCNNRNNCNTTKKVIGYKQPDACTMLIVFTPLLQSIAQQQAFQWSLDYDDVYQECVLVFLQLHRKGYYIHKQLLIKSITNHILILLRKNKNAPEIVSIYDKVTNNDGANKDICIIDVLPDVYDELHKSEIEHLEHVQDAFLACQKLAISILGERRWKQLYRDYGHKHTTSLSRKDMQTLKRNLAKLGITKYTIGGF